jgi:hypothetical protein
MESSPRFTNAVDALPLSSSQLRCSSNIITHIITRCLAFSKSETPLVFITEIQFRYHLES